MMYNNQQETRLFGQVIRVTLVIMMTLLLGSALLLLFKLDSATRITQLSAQIYAALVPLALLVYAVIAMIKRHYRFALPALAIFLIWITFWLIAL